MASETKCGECGTALPADFPGEFCPKCLLGLAFAGSEGDDDETLTGAAIENYVIERRLGEGGMATVYLARDVSLRRRVALKFLSPDIDSDPVAQRRFLREARAAAALDHPYICHIHEVAETDGRTFIAMEYVRGRTLKQRFAEGLLPLRETVRLAAEIAEAFERAHDGGIVHRDLKPANVMLTSDGHVKVMDFGLAKRVWDSSDDESSADITADLTDAGTTLGTLAYMSPEQVKGEPVDPRSDIFSFGTLLYQMLSGVHPFAREQQLETATAILRDDAEPLASHRDDLPRSLRRLVGRMLHKKPEQRPQSMVEVGRLLRDLLGESSDELVAVGGRRSLGRRSWFGWIAAGVLGLLLVLALTRPPWLLLPLGNEAAPVRSVAVMPFENVTGDAGQDYLSDGVTEALIRNLAGMGSLERVAPLDSAAAYSARKAPAAEVASGLNVEAVVEGTVDVLPAGVAISVRVERPLQSRTLLERTYDGRLADLPAVVADITRSVVAGLGGELTAEQERRLGRSADVHPQANASYMLGRHLLRQREVASIGRAIDYFEDAILQDTGFAAAFEGLADAYLLLAGTGYSDSPPAEVLPRAVRHAGRALELDPDLAGAHTVLAEALMTEARWDEARDHFERALRLAPVSPVVHQRYSLFLAARGELADAEAEVLRAVELDPVSAPANATLGRILYYRRDPVAARRQYERALEMEPSYVPAHLGLGLIALNEGRVEAAAGHFRQTAVPGAVIDRLAEVLAGRGTLDGAAVVRLRAAGGYVSPFYFSVLAALAGDARAAVEWLELARADRSDYVAFAGVDPIFDRIRDDPGFAAFVAGL